MKLIRSAASNIDAQYHQFAGEHLATIIVGHGEQ
jgi:hypothetical protein